jgi:hypothetical protein
VFAEGRICRRPLERKRALIIRASHTEIREIGRQSAFDWPPKAAREEARTDGNKQHLIERGLFSSVVASSRKTVRFVGRSVERLPDLPDLLVNNSG